MPAPVPVVDADDVSDGCVPAAAELPASDIVVLWSGSKKAKILHIDKYCTSRRPSQIDYYTQVRHVELDELCNVCAGSERSEPQASAVAAAGVLESASNTLTSAAGLAEKGMMRHAANERDSLVELLEALTRKFGTGLGRFSDPFRCRVDELSAAAQQLPSLPPPAAVSRVVEQSAVELACAAVAPPGLATAGPAVRLLVREALQSHLTDVDAVVDAVVAEVAALQFPEAVDLGLLDTVPCLEPVDGESVAVFVERVWRGFATAEAVSAAKTRVEMLPGLLSDVHDVLVWCPFVPRRSWKSSGVVSSILDVFVAEPVSFGPGVSDFLPPLLLKVPSVCADVLAGPADAGVRVSVDEDFGLLESLAETVLGLGFGERAAALQDLRAVLAPTPTQSPRR